MKRHSDQGVMSAPYEANVARLFVFRFVWEFMLFLPIWVLYLQEVRGYSLTQVALLDLVFWLTVAVGEMPTGMIADTWGRKYSLLVGTVLSAAAISLFALAPTYPLLVLANTLWALAFTCDSGAAQALFYDSLQQAGRQAEYTRLRSRLAIVEHAAIAISSACGGLLGALDLRVPFLAYAVILLASLGLVVRLVEPPREADPMTGTPLSYSQTLHLTVQIVRQQANLRWALVYSGLMPLAVAVVSVVFLQPHARSLGIPVAAMGLLVLGLRVARMLGAALSPWLVQRFGESAVLRSMPGLIVAGIIGLGLWQTIGGMALFAIAGFATSATAPVVEAMVLQHTPRRIRATVLSIDSLLFRLLFAGAELGLGVIGDRYGLPLAFLGLGLSSGTGMVAVLVLWWRAQRATLSAISV